jgi:hypothetical protein
MDGPRKTLTRDNLATTKAMNLSQPGGAAD